MPKWWPIGLAVVVALAALAVGMHTHVGGDDHWVAASRFTARAGFPFLIITYSASSLARLWPADWSKTLLRDRKWWGLAFAAAHTVHLYALINFLRAQPVPPDYLSLSPAILAYVLLYAMVLTSWRWAYKALGKWWKRLHRLGIHYIWLIFAAAYVLKAFEPGQQGIGVAFGAIAFGALGLRIAAWQKARAKRVAA
jgi:sulfoxide reductase heme-binding subunit YedZ